MVLDKLELKPDERGFGRRLTRVIDSHVHLDRMALWTEDGPCPPQLKNDRYGALIPGIVPAETERSLARPGVADGVDFAAGAHPWFLPDGPPDAPHLEAIEALTRDARVVAIGEIGLDWVKAQEPEARAHQEAWFRAQLVLARRLKLPVVVHCVRAHGRCVELIEEVGGASSAGRGGRRGDLAGVIHAYSGSAALGARYARSGFALGIGAAVTRSRSRRVRAAARELPIDDILLETDAPFMATGEDAPGSGTQQNIESVYRVVAELRGLSHSVLCERVEANYERIFSRSQG